MSDAAKQLKELHALTFPDQPDSVIVLYYSGAGDEGDLYFDTHQSEIHPSDTESFEQLGYAFLEEQHGGWEINEGQCGSIIITSTKVTHDYQIQIPAEFDEEF